MLLHTVPRKLQNCSVI